MAVVAEVKMYGTEVLARELGVTLDRLQQAVAVAVYGQGLALLELANRKGMVPVETGRLRASAYVTLPVNVGGAQSVEIGYGQANGGVDYASERHEMDIASVSKGGFALVRGGRGHSIKAGGVSKWLEKAVNIHARSLQLRLYETLAPALARGFTVGSLAAAGIPTAPHDPAPAMASGFNGISLYQRKYGFTREQARSLRQLKRSKAIKMVRRWSRKKRRN